MPKKTDQMTEIKGKINDWVYSMENELPVESTIGSFVRKFQRGQLKNQIIKQGMSEKDIRKYINEAYEMKRNNNFEAAFKILEPLSRADSNDVEIQYHLGWIYLHRYMLEETDDPDQHAIQHFERALKGKKLKGLFRVQAWLALCMIYSKQKNQEEVNKYLKQVQDYQDQNKIRGNGPLQTALNLTTWMYDLFSETDIRLNRVDQQFIKTSNQLEETNQKLTETLTRLKQEIKERKQDSHLVGMDQFGEHNLTLEQASVWINSNLEEGFIVLDQTKEIHELKGPFNNQSLELRESLILEKLMRTNRPMPSVEIGRYLSELADQGRIQKREEETLVVKVIMHRLREKLKRRAERGILDDPYEMIPRVDKNVGGYQWNPQYPWRIVRHRWEDLNNGI